MIALIISITYKLISHLPIRQYAFYGLEPASIFIERNK